MFGKSFDAIFTSIKQKSNDIEKISEQLKGLNPLLSDKQAKSQAKQQVGGLLSYIFKDDSKNKLVQEFESFIAKVNETGKSAKDLAKEMGDDLNPQIRTYIRNSKDGELTTEGFNASIGNLSLSAKAGKIALQGLAIAGNALLAFAVTEGINLLVMLFSSLH